LIATDCEKFLHLAQEGPAVWLVLPGFTPASSAAPHLGDANRYQGPSL
jgi:hypothetical protein